MSFIQQLEYILKEKLQVTFYGRVIGNHCMLEEMGKTIVFLESPNDPGRPSILWSPEDIDEVLRKNKIIPISMLHYFCCIVFIVLPIWHLSFNRELNLFKVLFWSHLHLSHWNHKAFSKLRSLRLLVILCDLHLSLRVLVWWGYPLNGKVTYKWSIVKSNNCGMELK